MSTVTSPKTKKILIALFVIFDLIVVLLLARFVFFKEQFNQWGQGLENMSAWKDYKQNNPNATDDEADTALKKSFAEIELWKEEYKRKNPGTTNEQADQAWADSLNALSKWRTEYKQQHPEATEAEIDKAWSDAWEK